MTIYLASGSPRRRELLDQIGIKYTVMVSGIDEKPVSTSPERIVEELSGQKADDVSQRLVSDGNENFCVIGADTVVACDGRVMGKPADEEDAYRMLSMLSGREHQVYTGVSLIICRDGKLERISFHEKTDVYMYEISDRQIRDYIESGEPMDKAGAYGIQAKAAAFIKGISGDYYNVVGLPIGRIYQELCKLELL